MMCSGQFCTGLCYDVFRFVLCCVQVRVMMCSGLCYDVYRFVL